MFKTHNIKRAVKAWMGYGHLPPRVSDKLPGKDILVLAPHPDDEALGCGGSLLGLSSNQNACIVFLTDGGMGDPKGKYENIVLLRKKEAKSAWEKHDHCKLEFLGFPDGKLGENVEKAIEDISKLGKFDLILTTSPVDRHPDHRASAKIAVRLSKEWSADIWAYEVWTVLPVSRVVDITERINQKISLIRHYKSQLDYQNLEHNLIGLNAYRSIDGGSNSGYMEGFLELSPEDIETFS